MYGTIMHECGVAASVTIVQRKPFFCETTASHCDTADNPGAKNKGEGADLCVMLGNHLHNGLVAIVVCCVVVASCEFCGMSERLAAPVHASKLDSQLHLGMAWLEAVHLGWLVLVCCEFGFVFFVD